MKERFKIIFHGVVQGVGFRYTAYHAAQSLGLTGNVRNLPDGTVLCCVQGEGADIDKMLDTLYNGRYIYITHTDIKKEKIIEDERYFSIVE